MKKKILYVCPRFHTNLIGSVDFLIKNNFNVKMLVSNTQLIEDHRILKPTKLKQSVLSKFICIIFNKINKNNKFYFPEFKKLKLFIKKFNPDLVILRNYNKIFSMLIIFYCKVYKLKILFYEQLDKKFFDKSKFKLYFYFLRNKILNSKLYSPIFQNFKKHSLNKSFLFIPFLVKGKKKKIKKIKNIKILFVGKFIPRKNLVLLLNVLKRFDENNYFELIIVGEVSTNEHKKYFNFIKNKIKQQSFKNKIFLKKNVKHSHINLFYQKVDLFILPSTNEPASISVLESLRYCTPVIASETNGSSFYIKNFYNGLTFKDNSLIDLKKKINFFFKKKHIITKYTKNCLRDLNNNLYEEKFLNNITKVLK